MTPGHDLERDPRSRAAASASSPPRPNTNGSPPLSRTTACPARACSSSSAFVASCGTCSPPPILADVDDARASARAPRAPPAGSAGRGARRRPRAMQLERPRGQQAGVARPGADEVDACRRSSPRRAARRRRLPRARRSAAAPPEPLGVGGVAGELVAHPRRAVGQADERAQRQPRRRRARRTRRPACCTSRRAPRDERALAAQRASTSRSSVTATAASRDVASPTRASKTSVPWPGAGTSSRRAARRPPSRARAAPARRRPARARRPRRRRACRRRVSTLPRSSTTSRSGRAAQQLRAAPQAARADAGALRQRRRAHAAPQSASRGSARGGAPTSARPSGSAPGTSFAECTARSTSPASSAALELLDPALLVAGARRSPVVRRCDDRRRSRRARRALGDRAAPARARARCPRVPSRTGVKARSWRSVRRRAPAPASHAAPSSSPNSSRSELQAAVALLARPACACAASARAAGGSIDRAGDRLDACEVALGQPTPSGRRSRRAPGRRSRRRARAARRWSAAPRACPSHSAKRWISSSTISSARRASACATGRLRAARPPARSSMSYERHARHVAARGDRCRAARRCRRAAAAGRSRAAMTSSSSSAPTIGCGEEVEATTMSARSSWPGSSSKRHAAAEALARATRARSCAAVGDEDRLDAVVGERLRGQLARLAGAEDQRRRGARGAERVLGRARRRPRRRDARPLADRRLGAHALAGRQRGA